MERKQDRARAKRDGIGGSIGYSRGTMRSNGKTIGSLQGGSRSRSKKKEQEQFSVALGCGV